MLNLKEIVEGVLSTYTIKQVVKSKEVKSKDKTIKKATVRYVVIVPKAIPNVQPKKRTEHQLDIEKSLSKYKKYINLNGRVSVPGSKNFLATTIDDDTTTYIIGLKEESNALVLLPGKINLKNPVVGQWLTAIEMKKRILQHIDENSSLSADDNKSYHDLLKAAIQPNTNPIKYDVPKNENNAEFFELVSAINLASLLKNKNSYITDTLLDMPDKYKKILGTKDVKIYVPSDSTFALLDYFIDYKGVADMKLSQLDKETKSLKISVKAKLSAAAEGKYATGDTNTIKFTDLFDGDLKNVDEWYKNLSKYKLEDLKKQQYGPKIIAYAGVESSITKLGTMYPIKALGQLLSVGQDKVNIKKQLAKTLIAFGQKKVVNFKGPGKTEYTNDEVTAAYMDIITNLSSNIANYRKEDPLKVDMVSQKKNYDIVLAALPLILQTSKSQKIKENVANIGVICERVLQNSSSKESESKYNFFYMFYDQVLEKKHIIYAVPTRLGSTQIKFKYLAYANWLSEYKNWQGDIEKAWIGLRGKSNANHLGDYGALGISV